MLEPVLNRIRQRTRSEWVKYLNDNLTNVRIWIQENGEKAALGSLVFGVFLVAAFKLIFTLLILAVFAFGLIWLIANDQHTQPSESASLAESNSPRDEFSSDPEEDQRTSETHSTNGSAP